MTFEYYSLVIYPKIEKGEINKFRKKYDYLVDIIEPHITLIFPVKVPSDIKEDSLMLHLNQILKKWKRFDIEIKGLHLSWDNWLFLLITKGNQEIIRLHGF